MKIVAVSKPIKHIRTVVFDTGEFIELYDEYMESAHLDVGCQMSEDEMLYHRERSEEKRAFSRAVYYLADADYSKKGMVLKLRNAKFEDFAAAFAAEKLEKMGYIDDYRFAEHLAERYNENLISNKESFYKMLNKGLEREAIKAALEKYSSDETEKIYSLILKKYERSLESDEKIKKMFDALLRKGFSPYDIKSALKKISE